MSYGFCGFRRCSSIIEPEGFTWRLVVFRFGPAAIFNLAVQILYTLSMANLSASVATALSAPTVAISYIFSWLFLKQPLLMIKVGARPPTQRRFVYAWYLGGIRNSSVCWGCIDNL